MANMKKMAVVLAALALIVVGFGCEREVTGDVEVIQAASTSCFDCHSDQDFALTVAEQQWETSKHASGENTNRTRLYNSRYQGCEGCHTHQGFVARTTELDVDFTNFTPIHCFTCHAPHSTGTLALRVSGPVSLQNGFTFDRGNANLCASCHQSRRDVNTYVTDGVELSEHYGPHYSNQSARRPAYRRMIASGRLKAGLAVDDGAALHFVDGKLSVVVTSRPEAAAYRLRRRAGQAVEKPLDVKYLG